LLIAEGAMQVEPTVSALQGASSRWRSWSVSISKADWVVSAASFLSLSVLPLEVALSLEVLGLRFTWLVCRSPVRFTAHTWRGNKLAVFQPPNGSGLITSQFHNR
jgi:hypothetical protein